jgi:glycosyltransferase involved in cell wall biosynthesis
MTTPKVTILMSVYNGEKYLKEAIDSMLNQSFSDFEFLVFNDCSTDSSREIILSYNDPRIVLVDNEKNIGLTKTLNKGISLAKGEYIARMDADDVSHLDRLNEQVKFLDKNTDVCVCGTWVKFLKEKEILEFPLEKNELKVAFLCCSCFAHPSVMIRKSFLEKYSLHYNEQLLYAQDYELWVKCSHLGALGNIGKALLFYRNHEDQISFHKKNQQQAFANIARLLQLEYLGITPSKDEEQLHCSLMKSQFEFTDLYIQKSFQWVERLTAANQKTRAFPEFYFNRLMASTKEQLLLTYYQHMGYDFALLKLLFNSPYQPFKNLSLINKSKLFFKCILHLKNKK